MMAGGCQTSCGIVCGCWWNPLQFGAGFHPTQTITAAALTVSCLSCEPLVPFLAYRALWAGYTLWKPTIAEGSRFSPISFRPLTSTVILHYWGVRQRLSNLNLLFKERQEAAWARGREASRAGTTPSTPHHGNSRPLGRTLDDNVFGKSVPQRCPHCGSGRPHIYIDTEIGAWACFSCGYRVHLFTPFTGRDKERRNSRDSMSCAPEPYTTNLKLR